MSKTKLQQLSPATGTESGTRVFPVPALRAALTGLMLAALLGLSAGCNDDSSAPASSGFNDVPDVTLTGRVLADRQQIEIEVDVPSRHHAYLDSGKYENLIPIAFDWQAGSPELTTAPAGEQDDDVNAKVLRGKGRFVFAVQADQIAALTDASPAVRVRSQICDEDKGICYRPTWNELKL